MIGKKLIILSTILSSLILIGCNIPVHDLSSELNPDVPLPLNSPAIAAGNNGIITIANIASRNLDMSWTTAIDTKTVQQEILYKVVISLSPNINTLIDAEINGTIVTNWTANINSVTVIDLVPDTTYYFNVVARNTDDDKTLYAMKKVTTAKDQIPVPGNNGNIDVEHLRTTSMTLNWAKATDIDSIQESISYKVVYSLTNNISTIDDAETNGIIIQDWTADINTINITDLEVETNYYFTIIIKDMADNKAIYSQRSITTATDAVPAPGNTGIITASAIEATSITLDWTKGTDDNTGITQLQYKAAYSTTPNIDTVEHALNNGICTTWITDIDTVVITGLTSGITYFVTVIIQDEYGNKSTYTMTSFMTSDTIPPTLNTQDTIIISNLSPDSTTLAWTKATDNVDNSADLEYRVVKSLSNTIDTETNALANGEIIVDWTVDIDSTTVDSLLPGTDYWFNVLARDTAANITAYAMKAVTTPDRSSPTPGSEGTITISTIQPTSLTLSWQKAADDVSSTGSIQYCVYQSLNPDIDTFTNIQNNGTLIQDWTSDIDTLVVTNLTPGLTYHYNIIIKDEADNTGVYTMASAETPDNVSPVPGNSGTLFTSNIMSRSLTLNWIKATDEANIQSAMEYKVIVSGAANINDITTAETNGTMVIDWTFDINNAVIQNLLPGTTYYINVITRDPSDNYALYTMTSVTTADGTAPIPGNYGTITASMVQETTLTLRWFRATDNMTSQSELEYRVFMSSSANIDMLEDVYANGTPINDWTFDIANLPITGLTSGTTYYFNVLCRDMSGNEVAYIMQSVTTDDVISPIAGNAGTITTDDIQHTSLRLNWYKATDDVTIQTNIEYKVVQSSTNNLDNIIDAELNDTLLMDWTADIATYTVTDLTAGTTYYFNILARDSSDNMTIYTMTDGTTNTDAAPIPGDSGIIIISGITTSSLTLSWTGATDDLSVQTAIEYKVVQSLSNNVDTITNAELNDTLLMDWTADLTTYTVTGLTDDTAYYFNILARDTGGNKTIYTMATGTTIADLAPLPGGSGTITTSNIQTSSIDLFWASASDDVTPQNNIEYCVVMSDSDNINTIANAKTNGTIVTNWSENYNSTIATGLTAATTYYFTVIIRDEIENEALYNTQSATTLNPPAPPVPANSGTLISSNIQSTSVQLTWTKATDDYTSQSQLEYKVVRSTSDNITTVPDAEANGTTVIDWTTNIETTTVTDLVLNTTYYFNVLVRDTDGMISIYTTTSAHTMDSQAPTPGNSGIINAPTKADTMIILDWEEATDDSTTQSQINYMVVKSTSANIATVNDAETNGDLVSDWTPDINTVTATVLTADTTYYFTIICRDNSGNKTVYTMTSFTTNSANVVTTTATIYNLDKWEHTTYYEPGNETYAGGSLNFHFITLGKFNLAGISGTIQSAQLSIRAYEELFEGSNSIDIHQVSQSWSEEKDKCPTWSYKDDSLNTWGSLPDGAIITSFTVSSPSYVYHAVSGSSIVAMVQDWITGTNNGFMLNDPTNYEEWNNRAVISTVTLEFTYN